ncbi:phosphatase PAP2 family protein [Streptomyces sp. H10-C2]|uniref:phosphatase PAP2 family protein n=1 Tax=unclassified Streptomyces TaxID=2593676 RepID=UPI0024B8ED5B|nr:MULTISPECIES: phosphatase PAP2 family protein [unclassified Streptomyces]MDJ0345848.1 phosphatase PAP2 family protein [Streptomyces sp. PH10-H1]MDJ0371186.1 phosphatase PAP2 family protein [Streptomyces sp. H10-C2]
MSGISAPTAAQVPAPTTDAAETSGRRRFSPAPPPARALALGVVFLLVTAVLGFMIHADPARPLFQGLDARWLSWMGGPHDGLYAAAAAVLNWFGGPLGVVVPLALLIFLIARKRWWSLLYLLTAYLAGNMAVVQILKYWVDRPRPAHPLVRVDHGSFPSGHAAGTALLVVIVGALLVPASRRRAWWFGGALFTVAMMWSRTWLHAHWLSDTVAGAMAGAGVALLLWRVFAPLLAREGQGRRPERAETCGTHPLKS